jgi:hypothetical protein
MTHSTQVSAALKICCVTAIAYRARSTRRNRRRIVAGEGPRRQPHPSGPYNSEQVYKLRGSSAIRSILEFEAGESFVGLGAGDIEGLSFVGQDNHLFLKPKAAKVATNLTVLTNRRHYQFDYTALSQRPEADENVIYALRFTYAPSTAQAAARRRQSGWIRNSRTPQPSGRRISTIGIAETRLKAGRRIRRWRPHAIAICRQCRFARDFRAQ